MSYREYLMNSLKLYREIYNEFIKVYPFTTDDLEGEEWREIFPRFEISSFGRLKSFCRHEPRILKPQILHIYLCYDFRHHELHGRRSAHRLVAQAFIPNPDNKPQVNHIDGNKFNNHVSNLEWVTSSENIQHALINGLKKSGENNYLSVLTNEQVKWLRAVYKPYDKEFGAIPLARKFGVSEQTIRVAIRGKHYKFI